MRDIRFAALCAEAVGYTYIRAAVDEDTVGPVPEKLRSDVFTGGVSRYKHIIEELLWEVSDEEDDLCISGGA